MNTNFLRRLVLLSVFLAPVPGFSVGENFGKLPALSACPNDIAFDAKIRGMLVKAPTQFKLPNIKVQSYGNGKQSESVGNNETVIQQ